MDLFFSSRAGGVRNARLLGVFPGFFLGILLGSASADEMPAAHWLPRRVTLRVREASLQQAVGQLARQTGAVIRFHGLPSGVDGVGRRLRVSCDAEGLSLAATLDQLLHRHGYDWTVTEAEIEIWPRARLWANLPVRVHRIKDLVTTGDGRTSDADRRAATVTLMEQIKNRVTPQAWRDVGGRASLAPSAGGLIVTHTAAGQTRIAQLLRHLRSQPTVAGQPRIRPEALPGDAIDRLLDRRIRLQINALPLDRLVAKLDAILPIRVSLDTAALQAKGIRLDQPLSIRAEDISLRAALRQLLRELNLTWRRGSSEHLILTTQAAMQVVTYPVSALAPQVTNGARDMDALIEILTNSVVPDSWDAFGGAGKVSASPAGHLIIRQTAEAHDQIRRLLARCLSLPRSGSRSAVAAPAETVLLLDRANARRHADLRKRLRRRIERWRWQERSLRDFVVALQDRAGVDVLIDRRALDDIGVDVQTKIDFDVNQLSLENVAYLALQPLGLQLGIRDEMLTVTSEDALAASGEPRVYPIRDLVTLEGRLPQKFAEHLAENLIETISSTVAPDTWETVGGPGTIAYAPACGALLISTTDAIHQQLADLLENLRRARRSVVNAKNRPQQVYHVADEPTKQIFRRLTQRTDLEARKLPLRALAEQLRVRFGVPAALDREALDEQGIADDTVLSGSFRNLPCGFAVEELLRTAQLAPQVRDGAVLITSLDRAEAADDIRLYCVPDLVLPATTAKPSDKRRDPEIDRILKSDFDTLINLLTTTIAPETWDEVGGPGTITEVPLASVLVISQQPHIHAQIGQLLTALRQAERDRRSAARPAVLAAGPPAQAALYASLTRAPSDKILSARSLAELRKALAQATSGAVVIDAHTLKDAGLSARNLRLDPIPATTLADTLTRTLSPHKLAWTLRSEALWITTGSEAEKRLPVRVYPVRHWVKEGNGVSIMDLEEKIRERFSRQTWDDVGGPAALGIWPDGPALVIAQSPAVHLQVEAFLRKKPD